MEEVENSTLQGEKGMSLRNTSFLGKRHITLSLKNWLKCTWRIDGSKVEKLMHHYSIHQS